MSMGLGLIAAIARNGVIGRGGDLDHPARGEGTDTGDPNGIGEGDVPQSVELDVAAPAVAALQPPIGGSGGSSGGW